MKKLMLRKWHAAFLVASMLLSGSTCILAATEENIQTDSTLKQAVMPVESTQVDITNREEFKFLSNSKYKKVLTSWNTNSINRAKIIAYVEDITNKNSKNFVPEEDRIVAFDMDGTILCEKPIPLNLMLTAQRITTDLKDNKALNDKLQQLLAAATQKPIKKETYVLAGEVYGEAFAGMAQDDFVTYVKKFSEKAVEGYTNTEANEALKYKETFYKPMIELIEYLHKNNFKIYIVSGSEQAIVWGMCDEILPFVPKSQEIGSDVALVGCDKETKVQDTKLFKPTDVVTRSAEVTFDNEKLNKVYNMYHYTGGKKPILAFGNTSGDFSMLNYALSNTKYQTMAFFVSHDDAEREVVSEEGEYNELRALYGWNTISMKDEFKQVFMVPTSKKSDAHK